MVYTKSPNYPARSGGDGHAFFFFKHHQTLFLLTLGPESQLAFGPRHHRCGPHTTPGIFENPKCTTHSPQIHSKLKSKLEIAPLGISLPSDVKISPRAVPITSEPSVTDRTVTSSGRRENQTDRQINYIT